LSVNNTFDDEVVADPRKFGMEPALVFVEKLVDLPVFFLPAKIGGLIFRLGRLPLEWKQDMGQLVRAIFVKALEKGEKIIFSLFVLTASRTTTQYPKKKE